MKKKPGFIITFYKIANPTSQNGFATVSQITKLNKIFRESYLNNIRHGIKVKIMKYNDNRFLFYAQIPSENGRGVYYDVVIEMEKSPNDKSFLHAPLTIWSNDPNFQFTYTWVMNNNGLIPEFLIPKCSTIALTKEPEERNPLKLWHIHKYTIFLRYHILFKGYLNPVYLEKDYEKGLTESIIFRLVKSQEEKYNELKSKGGKIEKDIEINRF